MLPVKESCVRFAVLLALATCTVGAAIAQDAAKPEEQVTGSGGRFLRYSTKQVSVELSGEERQTLARVRDRRYAAAPDPVLDAIVASLVQQGYVATSVDREFRLVEARHDEVLVSKGRETLRGLLKSKMALPGKPDHQQTEALIMLMPAADGHGVLARARFRQTVWDSNGDSRTAVLSDPAIYEQFYTALGSRLGR